MHKIKSIASLVNSEKKLYLCNSNGAQWIGTGQAMYPIFNLPSMDIQQFAKLLDVPADTKSRNKYFFKELDDDLFDFVDEDASVCKPLHINRWSFFRGSTEYMPLCTSKGLIFLETEWLKGIARQDMLEVCEAYNPEQNHSYIIVKEGLYVAAMFEPSKHVLDDSVGKELYSMLASLQVGQYAKRSEWLKNNLPPGEDEEVGEAPVEPEVDNNQLMLEAPAADTEDKEETA